MPTYEYRCKDCDHEFSLRMHMKEHEKKRPKCPECGSRKLAQKFSVFLAKTARKS